jgi:calcium-dependent protein kinase
MICFLTAINRSKSDGKKTRESKASTGTRSRKSKKGSTKSKRKNTKDDIRIAKDVFVLHKTTQFRDDYELLETLGEGAYGVVGKCKNKQTGAIRAVKRLSKSNITEKELKNIANEIQIVKELDHPNILRMYEEYEDSKFLYIVTELIEGGELFDELLRRKKFTEKDCGIIVKQLLE